MTAGRVPVYAGAGGLLLPPYLVTMPQRGLVDYTRAVAGATDLPLIVYNRSNWRRGDGFGSR